MAATGQHLEDGETRPGDPKAPRPEQFLASHLPITARRWGTNKADGGRSWRSPHHPKPRTEGWNLTEPGRLDARVPV
ncbi:hypothetical protein Pen02_05180 [Plantactinospora endophytica]|uniref:Uncharacterized protein n=1 Tax=Plantactinospora endophytica TaxID=673535 RepID=A0ABQ4DSZ8_9ACTN|nr:hypothetical protein Pen02_05180 [Plantactinospora endophytica]